MPLTPWLRIPPTPRTAATTALDGTGVDAVIVPVVLDLLNGTGLQGAFGLQLGDYWVADVIVIEVNGLVNNYESISLMYYNPWETSNSVRYVSSCSSMMSR